MRDLIGAAEARGVLLARHGETADNLPPMRLTGQRDSPLTERGVLQARQLAEAARAAGIASIYTSPLGRARDTAAPVAEALGLTPTEDLRLAESERGDWEGRLVEEIARREPDLWASWQRPRPDFRFPGGESLEEHMARVRAVIEHVLATARRPALLVCHGGTIRCALVAAGAFPLEEFHRVRVPHATLIPLRAEAP